MCLGEEITIRKEEHKTRDVHEASLSLPPLIFIGMGTRILLREIWEDQVPVRKFSSYSLQRVKDKASQPC